MQSWSVQDWSPHLGHHGRRGSEAQNFLHHMAGVDHVVQQLPRDGGVWSASHSQLLLLHLCAHDGWAHWCAVMLVRWSMPGDWLTAGWSSSEAASSWLPCRKTARPTG